PSWREVIPRTARFLASDGLRDRSPNLHRSCRAVGPRVIRNKGQRDRPRLSRLAGIAKVETALLHGFSISRAGMAQQNNSTKQVVPKFFLELRARFGAQVQRYLSQRHAFRLIDLFQTINEWPALNRNAASVFDNFRVGFEKLRLHIELHMDDVASGPSASNRKILAGSGACD